jgi:hypothetical protein
VKKVKRETEDLKVLKDLQDKEVWVELKDLLEPREIRDLEDLLDLLDLNLVVVMDTLVILRLVHGTLIQSQVVMLLDFNKMEPTIQSQ